MRVCTKQRTFTEKHVPDTENSRPGQRPGEETHEPLRHVQYGLDSLLFLQQKAQSPLPHFPSFLFNGIGAPGPLESIAPTK